MFNLLKKLFKKKKKFTDEDYELHYEKKSKALENILGKIHDLVGHAIIPFQIGGTVDMYYFLESQFGSAFATMELIEPDGTGSKPNRKGQTYELVAFTKQKFSNSDKSKFSKIERRMCSIFTIIGNFSYQAVLNPLETCEIPQEEEENNCLIFDEYKVENKTFKINDKEHTLLMTIEVFREEMNYAMQNGTPKLIEKLKEKGYYPYSDLDRKSVI